MKKEKMIFTLENIRKAQKNPDKIEALDDAISILKGKPYKGCISRSHFDERIRAAVGMVEGELSEEEKGVAIQILAMLSTEPPAILPGQQDWIPVKYHIITEEERAAEELDEEWTCMLECPLPEDGEEILISVNERVSEDVCCLDVGYYLDSGVDWKEVDAWKPMPEGYKK